MAEPFDPGEFDAPPPSDDPHADYRTLLDAMRRAGAEGVAEQTTALRQRIEQDAIQRAEWGRTVGSEVRDLQRAATALQRASTGIWLDRFKEWLYAALIGLGLIFAAALAYHWAKEPKIEQHLYGCAGRWNAKTHTCKGGWVPLQAQQGP
jgi:hypothetical protein